MKIIPLLLAVLFLSLGEARVLSKKKACLAALSKCHRVIFGFIFAVDTNKLVSLTCYKKFKICLGQSQDNQ
ncbi:hypothetical protein ScPMuIL_006060 [Solemya velum]